MSRNQNSAPLAPGLYATPFSKAYWKDAAKELTRVKMLTVAAILIAVRVALKGLAIPIIPPTLMLNLGFFVNALGAMIFGPVVAVISAAISDTLGCLLFPNGPYFFPFILTELSGSLIFALFLYRAPLTNTRVILSRFCVCFLVNIVIQTPIMLLFYKVMLGKPYAIFDLPRILKNLVMFPIESVLLILFLDLLRPITYRMGLTYDPPVKESIKAGQIVFLVVLFLAGCMTTAAYGWYDYNTRNHILGLEAEERAAINHDTAQVLDVDLEDNQILIVKKLEKTLFHPEQDVEFCVYEMNEGAPTEKEWGFSNKKARENEGLTCVATGKASYEKDTGERLNLATEPADPS